MMNKWKIKYTYHRPGLSGEYGEKIVYSETEPTDGEAREMIEKDVYDNRYFGIEEIESIEKID
jgi:hypothetical protein